MSSATAPFISVPTEPSRKPTTSRPRLLVAEFRGTGDIAILVPFLRAAVRRYDVTLLAVPNAGGLLRRFVPEVELIPCVAPWALFSGAGNLDNWSWRDLGTLLRALRARRFAAAVSIWPIASDHFFLRLAAPRQLVGYGRRGFGWLLDQNLSDRRFMHRPEAWRRVAERLHLPGFGIAQPRLAPTRHPRRVVLHSGASQPIRVWPLERYAELVRRMRSDGWDPVILCDTAQLSAWRALGETGARVAAGMDDLIDAIADGVVFLGNDSGPGHIAALCGVPTFTIFGPQVPELFAPGHPDAAWIEGRPCRYKPCFDRCHYAEPFCLTGIGVNDVWSKLETWLGQWAKR